MECDFQFRPCLFQGKLKGGSARLTNPLAFLPCFLYSFLPYFLPSLSFIPTRLTSPLPRRGSQSVITAEQLFDSGVAAAVPGSVRRSAADGIIGDATELNAIQLLLKTVPSAESFNGECQRAFFRWLVEAAAVVPTPSEATTCPQVVYISPPGRGKSCSVMAAIMLARDAALKTKENKVSEWG